MFFGSEDLRSKRLWNIHESLIYSPDAAALRDVASWRILSSDLTRYEQIQKLGRFLRCEMQWGRAAFEHRGSKSRIRYATLKLLRFNEVVFQDFCSRNGKRSNFFSRRFNNARWSFARSTSRISRAISVTRSRYNYRGWKIYRPREFHCSGW